jgi:hypothetical protein
MIILNKSYMLINLKTEVRRITELLEISEIIKEVRPFEKFKIRMYTQIM